jgi:hypothetical protein
MAERFELRWHGKQATEKARAGAAEGLFKAAEHVLGESREIVPREEGTLARSGATSVDEGQLAAAVSYDTPYAVRQHEDMTYHHHDGQRAKYLEEPLLESGETAERIIGEAIRRRLG